MKVVINKCFGGFSLSPLAMKRMAEMQGKECYFFTGFEDKIAVSIKEASETIFFSAYSIPNPDFKRMRTPDADGRYRSANEYADSISLEHRPQDRSDPILVAVVEELGNAANGHCAKLSVVEIPDDVEYTIEEYDGMEHIAECHRTWG